MIVVSNSTTQSSFLYEPQGAQRNHGGSQEARFPYDVFSVALCVSSENSAVISG